MCVRIYVHIYPQKNLSWGHFNNGKWFHCLHLKSQLKVPHLLIDIFLSWQTISVALKKKFCHSPNWQFSCYCIFRQVDKNHGVQLQIKLSIYPFLHCYTTSSLWNEPRIGLLFFLRWPPFSVLPLPQDCCGKIPGKRHYRSDSSAPESGSDLTLGWCSRNRCSKLLWPSLSHWALARVCYLSG